MFNFVFELSKSDEGIMLSLVYKLGIKVLGNRFLSFTGGALIVDEFSFISLSSFFLSLFFVYWVPLKRGLEYGGKL